MDVAITNISIGHGASGTNNNLIEIFCKWNKTTILLIKAQQLERAFSLHENTQRCSRLLKKYNLFGSEYVLQDNITRASILKIKGEYDKSIECLQELLQLEAVIQEKAKSFEIIERIKVIYTLKEAKVGLSNDDRNAREIILRKQNELGLKFDDVFVTFGQRATIYQEFDFMEKALFNYELQKLQLQNDNDSNHVSMLLNIYMEIGFCSYRLKIYRDAYLNFEKALKLSIKIDEYENRTWILFNMSQCFLNDNNFFHEQLYYLIKCYQSACECKNSFAQCLSLEERYKLLVNGKIYHSALHCAYMHLGIAEEMHYEYEMTRSQRNIEEVRDKKSNCDIFSKFDVESLALIKNEVTNNNYDKVLLRLDILYTIVSEYGNNDLIKFECLALRNIGYNLFLKAEYLRNSKNNIDYRILKDIYHSAVMCLRQFLRMKPDTNGTIDCLKLLVRIYTIINKTELIHYCLHKLLGLANQCDNTELLCVVYGSLTCLYFQQGEYYTAHSYYERAIKLAKSLGRRDYEFEIFVNYRQIQSGQLRLMSYFVPPSTSSQ